MSGAPLFTLVIFMKVDNIVDVVLNFVLFFNLYTLVIFMKMTIFHHIIDACVEFCFLKKQFLKLTINMQLLYFITTVTSQVHSTRHHQRVGYSVLPSI